MDGIKIIPTVLVIQIAIKITNANFKHISPLLINLELKQ